MQLNDTSQLMVSALKPLVQAQQPNKTASSSGDSLPASGDSVSVQRPSVATDIERTAKLALPELTLPSQADVDTFQQDFQRAMTKANIDWSGKIELTMNAEGKVTVKGDHPDKARIEALFEQNSDLQQGFVKADMVQSFRKIQQIHDQRQQMLNNGASEEAANQWLVDQVMRITSKPASLTMVDGKVRHSDSQQQDGLAAMERLQIKYGSA